LIEARVETNQSVMAGHGACLLQVQRRNAGRLATLTNHDFTRHHYGRRRITASAAAAAAAVAVCPYS